MNIVNNVINKLKNVNNKNTFKDLKSNYPNLKFLFDIIEKPRPQIERIVTNEINNQKVNNENQLNPVSKDQNQEKYNNKNGSFVKEKISVINSKVDKATQIKNLEIEIKDMNNKFKDLSSSERVENQMTFNSKIAELNRKIAKLKIERKSLYNRGGSRKKRKNLSKKYIPSNLNNRHTRKSKPSHTKTRKRHP